MEQFQRHQRICAEFTELKLAIKLIAYEWIFMGRPMAQASDCSADLSFATCYSVRNCMGQEERGLQIKNELNNLVSVKRLSDCLRPLANSVCAHNFVQTVD